MGGLFIFTMGFKAFGDLSTHVHYSWYTTARVLTSFVFVRDVLVRSLGWLLSFWYICDDIYKLTHNYIRLCNLFSLFSSHILQEIVNIKVIRLKLSLWMINSISDGRGFSETFCRSRKGQHHSRTMSNGVFGVFNPEGMKCPVIGCTRIKFPSKSKFAHHWEEKHKLSVTKYVCSVAGCHTKCRRKSDMRAHIKRTHENNIENVEFILAKCEVI